MKLLTRQQVFFIFFFSLFLPNKCEIRRIYYYLAVSVVQRFEHLCRPVRLTSSPDSHHPLSHRNRICTSAAVAESGHQGSRFFGLHRRSCNVTISPLTNKCIFCLLKKIPSFFNKNVSKTYIKCYI